MNIGKKIKELRTARNLSQEKFAEHFDITPQAVSKWENGTAYPDITLLPALICLIFGVNTMIYGLIYIRLHEMRI